MRLPFLDRANERARLVRFIERGEGLAVVYGRRRLGKSRLIREAFSAAPAVYYVGDARDPALQRSALAREVARAVPGFADVTYPDWAALFDRLWREAPPGLALAIDELPELVVRSPEIPSLLQKRLDSGKPGPALVLAGSSQRVMHGLVLDGSAPLYGRASEILRLTPLPAGWIGDAFDGASDHDALEHFAAWGGVPRYWELAVEYGRRADAFRELVLDPLGVLHREPERLLADDTTDPARAASILALVGRGCHRVSEVAARLGLPATSLSRPLARLLDLGLLRREMPYGRSAKDTKRTYYRIADPFLRAWYRIVEPNRSRLEAGALDQVATEAEAAFEHLDGEAWEELARRSVPKLEVEGGPWEPAARWWGQGLDRQRLELDCVALSSRDPSLAVVGEAKRSANAAQVRSHLEALRAKTERCPILEGKTIRTVLFVARTRARPRPDLIGPGQVMAALR